MSIVQTVKLLCKSWVEMDELCERETNQSSSREKVQANGERRRGVWYITGAIIAPKKCLCFHERHLVPSGTDINFSIYTRRCGRRNCQPIRICWACLFHWLLNEMVRKVVLGSGLPAHGDGVNGTAHVEPPSAHSAPCPLCCSVDLSSFPSED